MVRSVKDEHKLELKAALQTRKDEIGEVNRGATETGSASSQVLAPARLLSSESNRLRLEVEHFLASVRAA